MPKGSPELTALRREEIIDACEKLYEEVSFRDITIKEISERTSFSRPSIYNYFQTKEEIFLALMQREYDLWAEELEEFLQENEAASAEELADLLAGSLQRREQLLKLLAMNLYDIEENSRPERLTDFKVAYGRSIEAVRGCLQKYFPKVDSERFIFVFFPFLFGVYPYAVTTAKQREAMAAAGIKYKPHSIYEIIYQCVTQLVGGAK